MEKESCTRIGRSYLCMLITLENIIQAVHSSKSESADKMMKRGVFTIFLFLSSGLHLSMANSVEDRCRVKVELFYDTFCPDVIDFIQGKLYPAWEELSDIMEIHWKPYGFTQVSVLSEDKFQDLNFRLRII